MPAKVTIAAAVREALGVVPEGLRNADLERDLLRWQRSATNFGAQLKRSSRASFDLAGSVELAWRLYEAEGYQVASAVVAGTVAGIIGYTLPPQAVEVVSG